MSPLSSGYASSTRPSRSRASGVRICRKMSCLCAWTCSRYCCSATAWVWYCWSSASFFRRIVSSSSSSIDIGSGASRVLHQIGVRFREFEQDFVGEGIEEFSTLRADRPSLLVRLRQETHRLELLHRLAGKRPRAPSGMFRRGPVVPPPAELRGEARRADRAVQVDLPQHGGDPPVPPVFLDRGFFRVHAGAGERRPFRRLDLALRLQAVFQPLDQEARRYILFGRHREHESVSRFINRGRI